MKFSSLTSGQRCGVWSAAWIRPIAFLAVWMVGSALTPGQTFRLPTANRALFEPNGEERYFVGTPGKSWTSGTFGCVRTDGQQMHEGIDIKSIQRDRRGEPTDLIYATADGVVAYMNPRAALSNYGKYLILRHRVEGMEIYSLYAHLSAFGSDLAVGKPVHAGDVIAVMGRTSNTHQGISKDRAHLHFELSFLINDHFPEWYHRTFPGQRNDHGVFNGLNLAAIDSREVFLQQARLGTNFSLVKYLRQQPELCRVLVRSTRFPWLQRCPPLVWRNPKSENEGVAAYELSLNYNGVAFQVIPRAASEITGSAQSQLLFVNTAERQQHPARHLVVDRGGKWVLTSHGQHLVDLYTVP